MKRLALAGLFLISCAKERTFIQLSSDVDFVALLVIAADGTLESATPLERYDENAPPNYAVDPDKSLYFIGWTSDQLGALAALVDSTVRLEAASGCRNALPPAEFYAKIDGDRLTEADEATAPKLGSAWLDAACTAIPTHVVLECEVSTLTAPIETGPCAYSVELDDTSAVPLVLRPDGGACVETVRPTECRGSADYSTGHRLLCEAEINVPSQGCKLILYERPAVPPFTEDVISLATVRPFLPAALREEAHLLRGGARPGYAFDILPVAGDTILVTVDTMRDDARDCSAMGELPPAELRAYDGTTLAMRWARPAPPCLSSLELDPNDPSGTGFIGVFRSGDQLSIGRFDGSGMVLTSTTIAETAMPRFVYETLVLPERNEIVFVLESLPLRTIITFDMTTFAQKARAPSALWIYGIDLLDPHTLVFAADPNANRCELDLDAPETIDCVEFGCFPELWKGLGHELFDFYRDPITRKELVSVTHSAASIWACDEEAASTTFYEQEAQPALMWPHPRDARLLLVSGIAVNARGELGGTLDVLDLDRRRVLPGTMSLTGMYTARLRTDTLGRVWLLHPWNATLARLTLRPPP